LPWIAAAYVVPYGGFLLLGGRAGDLLGNRPVLLIGLAVFGAASIACGLATNTGWLVVARAVQGVGAALTVPSAVAILATTFADDRARTRAFGVFSAAGASGFSAGLVLGGVITEGLSWRWIFLAKVPAVLVTLVVALRVIPGSPRRRHGPDLDLGGGITVTLAAVLLTYGVTRAGSPDVTWADIGVPMLGALVMTAGFVLIERRAPNPLLPRRVLARGTIATNLAALTVLAAPFGVSYIVTLYAQDVLHRSAWQTALTLLPGAVLSILVSHNLAPRLLNRFGLRAVYAAGLFTVAVGDAMLLSLDDTAAITLVVASTLLSLGVGMGLAYPAATLGGVMGIAESDRGIAAGLNNTALQIGGALGLAIIGTAISIALGADTVAESGESAIRQALQNGALAVTVLPLLGALVAVLGLPGRSHPSPPRSPSEE
jgi:MFS family permease